MDQSPTPNQEKKTDEPKVVYHDPATNKMFPTEPSSHSSGAGCIIMIIFAFLVLGGCGLMIANPIYDDDDSYYYEDDDDDYDLDGDVDQDDAETWIENEIEQEEQYGDEISDIMDNYEDE